MTDLRTAAQQALEALERADKISGYANNKKVITALRAALAQQAEPDHETRAELAEQQVVQLAEERDHYRNLWQKAQQSEPQPMHPELQKMWEDHIDKCFRAIPVPEQAEPVVRGAAYADALRWTIKACGAVQRHDGVWFGDDAAARLARVLSEGIATPQQAEPVEPVAWMHPDDGRVIPAMTKRAAQRDGGASLSSVRGYTVPLSVISEGPQPLTDEEIMDAFHAARNAKLGASQDNSKHRLSVVEIARAVERAHGIGEGA